MAPEVAWARVGGDHCLQLTGWSPTARDLLARADERDLAARIVVLPTALTGTTGSEPGVPLATSRLTPSPGRFTTDERGVTFVPRFPFLADTAYTVLVHPVLCDGAPATGDVDVADFRRFTLEARRSKRPPTTRVVAIHPSTPTVPRNLLRCYVEFSAPMSEGDAPGHVRLVDDATGEPIGGALLELDPELWDPARTRLTVLLDPARIKRGLAPHRDAGYALAEGGRVALVVDAGFRDADGRALVAGAEQRYAVGPDVRGRVDPGGWEIALPPGGTTTPLRVDFGRPLDHALVGHCIRIDDGHTATTGRSRIGDGGSSWTFTPEDPWWPVRHRLVVDAKLEDVAGNSVARVFDRDLADPSDHPVDATTATREFTPT